MRPSLVFAGLLTLTSLAIASPIATPDSVMPACYNPRPVTTSSVAFPAPSTTAAVKAAPTGTSTNVVSPVVQQKAVLISKAPYYTDRNFQIYALNAHNGARKNHKAPYLQWDNNLARAAQVWANDCRWEHSGGKVGPYGENMLGIYIGASKNADIDYPTYDAIYNSWYKEELAHYDFNKPGFSHATGHLTQVIWKGSTKVGCAWTYGKACNVAGNKRLFKFVCEYQTQGNILGGKDNVQWFRENVLYGRP